VNWFTPGSNARQGGGTFRRATGGGNEFFGSTKKETLAGTIKDLVFGTQGVEFTKKPVRSSGFGGDAGLTESGPIRSNIPESTRGGRGHFLNTRIRPRSMGGRGNYGPRGKPGTLWPKSGKGRALISGGGGARDRGAALFTFRYGGWFHKNTASIRRAGFCADRETSFLGKQGTN